MGDKQPTKRITVASPNRRAHPAAERLAVRKAPVPCICGVGLEGVVKADRRDSPQRPRQDGHSRRLGHLAQGAGFADDCRLADGGQFRGHEHGQRGAGEISSGLGHALDDALGVELGGERPEADDERLEAVALRLQTSNGQLRRLQLRERVSRQCHVGEFKAPSTARSRPRSQQCHSSPSGSQPAKPREATT